MDNNRELSYRKLAMIWILLLLVTWLPPLSLALQKATLEGEDSGTVLVFFPLGSTASDNFERIVRAKGAFLASVVSDHAWIVHSYDPGFVRRLKAEGVWAIFDPVLLDPVALLACGPISGGNDVVTYTQVE